MKRLRFHFLIGAVLAISVAPVAGLSLVSWSQSPEPQSNQNLTRSNYPPSNSLLPTAKPAMPAYASNFFDQIGPDGIAIRRLPTSSAENQSFVPQQPTYPIPYPPQYQAYPTPQLPQTPGYVKWDGTSFKAVHLDRPMRPEEMKESADGQRLAFEHSATLRNEDSDSEKAVEARKLLKEYLDSLFELDLKGKQSQVKELESRLEKLKQQVAKREGAKDRIVELKLTLLENDRGGLAFPANFNQIPAGMDVPMQTPTPTTAIPGIGFPVQSR